VLPLWLRVGGYGSASGARRQAPDAGSVATSVPKALTRPDGEHSDRESQARVQTRSAQSLPCKGEPEDSGRQRHRAFGPPRRRTRDRELPLASRKIAGAGQGFLPTISHSCLVF
jgi:hypothetical protein